MSDLPDHRSDPVVLVNVLAIEPGDLGVPVVKLVVVRRPTPGDAR